MTDISAAALAARVHAIDMGSVSRGLTAREEYALERIDDTAREVLKTLVNPSDRRPYNNVRVHIDSMLNPGW